MPRRNTDPGYHETIQSYSSVYSQGPDGKVKTATEKYLADDLNGKRTGKIYRERSKPNKRDNYTRHLGGQEIDQLFKRHPRQIPSIKGEVDTRLAEAGGRSGERRLTEVFPGIPDPFRGFGFDEDFGSWFQSPWKNDPFFRDF